jgi:hypothetical protein
MQSTEREEELCKLIAKWPPEARYLAIERWEMRGNFWAAVDEIRGVWAREQAGTDMKKQRQAREALLIDNEEQERKKC